MLSKSSTDQWPASEDRVDDEEETPEPSRSVPARDEKASAAVHMEQKTTYKSNGTQEDGFRYVIGSVLHRYLPAIDGCHQCLTLLTEEPPATSFIFARKYDDTSTLLCPSHNLFNYITAVDSVIERTSKNHLHQRALITRIHQKVMRQVPPQLSLTCQIHRLPFINIFIKTWIITSLKFILKEKCEKMNRQKFQRIKRKKAVHQSANLTVKRRKMT